MKYILMMNTMKAGQPIPDWPAKDFQAHIQFMVKLNRDLRESGGGALQQACFRPQSGRGERSDLRLWAQYPGVSSAGSTREHARVVHEVRRA